MSQSIKASDEITPLNHLSKWHALVSILKPIFKMGIGTHVDKNLCNVKLDRSWQEIVAICYVFETEPVHDL